MGPGGGGKARAFAIVGALLLSRCNLSPHPEDPGLNASDNGNKRSSHAADAGVSFGNGAGGSSSIPPMVSGSGGLEHGIPGIARDASAARGDATGSPRDGGSDAGDSGADAGADAAADRR
jgi:hypothetical protein